MKAKITTDTQGINIITEHMVNVRFTTGKRDHHFQVVVTILDGECNVDGERVYPITGISPADNLDTLCAIAERAAINHVKEWLKIEKGGRTFDTFLDLSREDVRGEGYDDKELSDPEMSMLAEDMAQEEPLMEAWHDALSELLEARGIGHCEDMDGF